jgi:hypothetical protein
MTRARHRVAAAIVVALVAACRAAMTQSALEAVDRQLRSEYADVMSVRLEDNLLMIQVAGDWSDVGAVRLACETVKPLLASQGAGSQDFAIYDRRGSVIATGHRC